MNKTVLNIIFFIFILLSLVLFILGAFATYEKKVYLNFYNGHLRSQKSIFYFLSIGREERRNETVLKFFSHENREKIPDRWFYHWTIYRDGRLHTRISGGLGIGNHENYSILRQVSRPAFRRRYRICSIVIDKNFKY